MSRSTIVTNEATMTMNAGILTLSGMILRSAEIIRLDMISTAVVESPIPSPFEPEVVTASVGHIPSISTSVGFSLIMPLYKRSRYLFITASLIFGDKDRLICIPDLCGRKKTCVYRSVNSF